jgi:hypothetical protein
VPSKSSRNILITTITSYLDLILYHHLQSGPLGSAHTDNSVSSTFEKHPGGISFLGCLVSSVFQCTHNHSRKIQISETFG